MENFIVCQVSFLPLADADGLNKVKKVLDIIKNSGLEYCVGKLSTSVTGEKSAVFKLMEDIHSQMNDQCSFIMDMRMTNFYE
jgi:uncharacterized protein YqgV (UPF0045/DUF77 family)